MTNVLYGIMCHRSAEYIQEQYQLLYTPETKFIYHADEKAPPRLKNLLINLAISNKNVTLIPSLLCSWAGFSLTCVMLNIIETACEIPYWDHLAFLSEDHLPLRSPQEISNHLRLNVDYVEANPYEKFYESGKEDIRNRSARLYRELPGVGAFATEDYKPDPSFFQALHHGSQWMTLCRATCVQLLRKDNRPFQKVFEHSILSDENAVQTWVAGLAQRGNASLTQKIATYVADPSRGGAPDMTFDEPLFFNARDQGYLFIRKRPKEIPLKIRQFFDETIPVHTRPTVVEIGNLSPSFNRNLMTSVIITYLNAIAKQYEFRLKAMPYKGTPSLFCRIEHTDIPRTFKLFVVSEDMINFKVISIKDGFVRGFAEQRIGDFAASVVRARLAEISFNREIHLASDLDHGFYQCSDLESLNGLVKLVHTYVTRMLPMVAATELDRTSPPP